MNIPKVIIFDVFGTLITHQGQHANPYRKLIKGNSDIPYERLPADVRRPFLTRNVPIDMFAEEMGLAHLIPSIRRELEEELNSFQLFPDVDQALHKLQDEGFRVAVCSNLAFEYGEVVRRLLPKMDAYVFSFEVGAAKPDPAIYAAACAAMDCRPCDVMFVGDSQKADVDGPAAFGMQSRLINREGFLASPALEGGETINEVLRKPDLTN